MIKFLFQSHDFFCHRPKVSVLQAESIEWLLMEPPFKKPSFFKEALSLRRFVIFDFGKKEPSDLTHLKAHRLISWVMAKKNFFHLRG